MQGLRLASFLAMTLAWSAPGLAAGQPLVADVTVHRAGDPVVLIDSRGLRTTSARLHSPGATFIKLHFSEFRLPAGVVVEISDPLGTERYAYSNDGRDAFTYDPEVGDDRESRFSAMSVSSETVRVRLLGNLAEIDGKRHALSIDYFMEGLSLPKAKGGGRGPGLDSTCGVDERPDAVCWAESHPEAFNRSHAVGKVVTTTGIVCTAWRAGPQNRIFTAEHCIASQADVSAAEVWFNFQSSSCNSQDSGPVTKVAGNTLLAVDETLDFALFSVSNFDKLAPFGFLGLEVRNGVQGERIYIPQHGYGQPKQLAVESDMNLDGLCRIDDPSHDGYGPDTDIGYYCDTVASSSGSPVITAGTDRVIALHHLGGCVNSGAKMSLIWPMVSQHFDHQVPAGDNEPTLQNFPPTARITYGCTGRICYFNATGSSDPDGHIASYKWDFGAGTTEDGVRATHRFPRNASYRVTLTVTDDLGATATTERTVKLGTPADPPPDPELRG